MKTNEVFIDNVKQQLKNMDKSNEWLANEIGVSKSLIGHIFRGERQLLPKRMEEIATALNTTTSELLKDPNAAAVNYTVSLRGNTSNRASKKEIKSLLFAIEDSLQLEEILANYWSC